LLDCQHEPTQLSSFYKSFVFELNKVSKHTCKVGKECHAKMAFFPSRYGTFALSKVVKLTEDWRI
jgi:hypothetical protein